MTSSSIVIPDHTRQVAFHQLLVAARQTWLVDTLRHAVGRVDLNMLKEQLGAYVPVDAQRTLATAGIRDEQVFPVPLLLEDTPTLVGYYRLLLGLPRKTFYAGGSGMGRFRAMEESGTLNDRQKAALPALCHAMCTALAELVRQLSPMVTSRDVAELPLLTLGSYFQGLRNNQLGEAATRAAFLAIADIVEPYIVNRTGNCSPCPVETAHHTMRQIRTTRAVWLSTGVAE